MQEFEIVRVLITDAGFLFYSWNLADFAIPIALILWGCIVHVPLSGVERRDMFALSSYIMFSLAAGTLLIIVLPMHHAETNGLGFQIMVSLVIVAFTLYRWYVKPRTAIELSDSVRQLQSEGKKSGGKT